MINIQINTEDLTAEFSLTRKEVDDMMHATVQHITSRFYEKWITEAKNSLHRTRTEYIQSLIVVDEGRLKGSVILKGDFPNMIEQGISAFDMKEGFAKSSKKTMKKDGKGWFLTIPFRYATPGAIGDSSVFTGVLPQSVYQAIKKKDAAQSQIGLGVEFGSGLKKQEIPAEYAVPKMRGEFSDVITKTKSSFGVYVNKTSLYEGLQKASKTYQSGGGSQYVSFRRVSDKSDPSSWIHSGILARNLADKALTKLNIAQEVDLVTDNYLAALGF